MRTVTDFLKGFFATVCVFVCIFVAIFGTAKAYENTVFVAFGAKKSAIAFTDDGIRILDFEIKI